MEIMHTMSSEANAPTPKRRNYSPALMYTAEALKAWDTMAAASAPAAA